jgi:plastocyanin
MPRRLLLISLILAGFSATAAELPQYTLVIRNHRFEPAELTVPAGSKFKLLVDNRDATPEEFESTEFNREKVVPANHAITVYVGPLPTGRYRFFGDFHQDTAQGVLVVE